MGFERKSVTVPTDSTSSVAGLMILRGTTGFKPKQRYSDRKSNGIRRQLGHRSNPRFRVLLQLIAIWYRAREAGLPRRRLKRAACCSEGRLNSLTIECGA